MREQYERQLKDLQEAYGEAMLELRARKKIVVPAGQGRDLMVMIQQGLRDEGAAVSMSQLYRWFEVRRRTVYCQPVKSAPVVRPGLAAPIKQLIEAEPSFGYCTVAGLLGRNKKTVQRIFRLMG